MRPLSRENRPTVVFSLLPCLALSSITACVADKDSEDTSIVADREVIGFLANPSQRDGRYENAPIRSQNHSSGLALADSSITACVADKDREDTSMRADREVTGYTANPSQRDGRYENAPIRSQSQSSGVRNLMVC